MSHSSKIMHLDPFILDLRIFANDMYILYIAGFTVIKFCTIYFMTFYTVTFETNCWQEKVSYGLWNEYPANTQSIYVPQHTVDV